jgi:predicted ferric reductase
MNAGKIFWRIFYFFSPLVLFVLVLSNQFPAQQQNPAYVGSTFYGTFAYVWLCYQFVISARPKFIEKHFGMDNLYRFHGIMAGVSLFFLIGHFVIRFGVVGFDPTNLGAYALLLFLFTALMASIFLVNSFLRRLKFIENLHRWVNNKLGVKRYLFVLSHNFSLAAATLMFMHVNSGIVGEISPAVRIAYAAFFLLGISAWLYHQILRPLRLKQHAFLVVENRAENQTVRSLHLKPRQGSLFHYKPGQFAIISAHNQQITPEPHPFTIASNPNNPEEIEFVIKASGDYTSQLDKIAVDNEVRVDAPFGVFSYLNHPEEKELVFVAGGIGITPFLSMLRWMSVNDPQRKVILLWGCRFTEDLIKAEEFERFKALMPHFRWHAVLSDEPDYEGETGFFDAEKLNRLAVNDIDVSSAGFYTCGPPIMMTIVENALHDLGVEKSRIHYEKFSF